MATGWVQPWWIARPANRRLSRLCDRLNVPPSCNVALTDPLTIVDTADFRLYNHAFILRRRIRYVDGFPAGDPEIVFKFRHPDLQKAAEFDVRPNFAGNYRIKFKAETLPLKDQVGGFRTVGSVVS